MASQKPKKKAARSSPKNKTPASTLKSPNKPKTPAKRASKSGTSKRGNEDAPKDASQPSTIPPGDEGDELGASMPPPTPRSLTPAAGELPVGNESDEDPDVQNTTPEGEEEMEEDAKETAKPKRPRVRKVVAPRSPLPPRSKRGKDLGAPDKPRPKRTTAQVEEDEERKAQELQEQEERHRQGLLTFAKMEIEQDAAMQADCAAEVRSLDDVPGSEDDHVEEVDGKKKVSEQIRGINFLKLMKPL